MGDAKHTPLPWEVGESLTGTPCLYPARDDENPVARFPYGEGVHRTMAEAEANARFVHHRVHIYDELLAACEGLLGCNGVAVHAEGPDSTCPTCRVVAGARAAIAKAKGATP